MLARVEMFLGLRKADFKRVRGSMGQTIAFIKEYRSWCIGDYNKIMLTICSPVIPMGKKTEIDEIAGRCGFKTILTIFTILTMFTSHLQKLGGKQNKGRHKPERTISFSHFGNRYWVVSPHAKEIATNKTYLGLQCSREYRHQENN